MLADDAGASRAVTDVSDVSDADVEPLEDEADASPTLVTPSLPAMRRLLEDASYRRLEKYVRAARDALAREAAEWDLLRQVTTFCRAARFAKDGVSLDDGGPADAEPLLQRFDDAVQRRAIGVLLASTMPARWRVVRPLLPDGTRGRATEILQPLPDEIALRADEGFALRAGDVPVPAPVFCRHLRGRALLDGVFRPGQTGRFLASKTYCLPAVAGDRCGGGDPIPVVLGEPCVVDGKRAFAARVPAARAYKVDDEGRVIEAGIVRDELPTTSPVPLEHLIAWLLAGGPQGGLDLEDVEDLALLVVASHLLKTRTLQRVDGVEKSVFAWLETADASSPRPFLERVRAAVRDACFDAVAFFAPDPRALVFPIVAADDDVARARFAAAEGDDASLAKIDWQARALALLEQTGIARAAVARGAPSTGRRLVEIGWTQAVLQPGYVGGRLPAQAQGDAFARLATTLLAPIGLLPLSSLREGRGASLLRVLSLPDDEGRIDVGAPERVVPAAYCRGLSFDRAFGLPRRADDPSRLDVARLDDDGRGAPIHDLAALQDRLADLKRALDEETA